MPALPVDSIGEEARAGAYLLLADLLEWGPTESLRGAAETSPILAGALRNAESQDELDASHTSAFGLQVYSYAGVFLHPGAQAGAGSTDLHEAYRELGFDPDTAGPGVDHLSTTLRALGHASAREAVFHASGDAAKQIRTKTRVLLDRHLLPWLPAWRSAVQRLNHDWPGALATQIVELVLLHRSGLGRFEGAPRTLPAFPDLEARETDLRVIADALTTPAVAGIFLSRSDVSRLAREVRAPTGFGPRSLLLENALQSAARYGTLAEIIDGIRAVCRAWEKELDAELDAGISGVAEATAPWRTRIGESITLLGRIGVAARNAAA